MNILYQLKALEQDIEYCKKFIPHVSENPEDYEGFLYKLDELEDEYLKLCLQHNIEPNPDIFML